MAKPEYSTYAAPLSAAIDVAIEALQRFPPAGESGEGVAHWVSVYRELKEHVDQPAPEYRNQRSLQHMQADVLTYFLEATGPTVDYFWQHVQQRGLPYQRVNRMAKILKRNRLTSRSEYDLVVDVLVPYQQEGLLTPDEAAALSRMIGEFENRKKSRA
ncbi:hypothetical protein I2I05_11830 [Hymenobacter sp. BT683]|uniref:Uncharacterized protein n=1 Tax=Hymenobacter jeongseonensis TaxID=2791027 RepID=A0ABS0IK01_9BACT|nr:hypothetical protein [Hymenobacter jeongseonensis]MBF9238085.1 hypothetical protein [Hymenobacter jeongseonensis]